MAGSRSGGGSGSGASREKRVAERIRTDISQLLARGSVRDPDVADAIISDVQVTNDLSLAKIFVRALTISGDEGGAAEVARRKRVLDALKRATGFLRRELAQTLSLKRVPELRFAWDDVSDRAQRLEEIFAEVRSAPARGGEGDER